MGGGENSGLGPGRVCMRQVTQLGVTCTQEGAPAYKIRMQFYQPLVQVERALPQANHQLCEGIAPRRATDGVRKWLGRLARASQDDGGRRCGP
jgi:hypothetical protein